MKIAMVHSFYSSLSPSGENAVVERQYNSLQKAGHDVELFALRTDDEVQKKLYAIRTGARVAIGSGNSPTSRLVRFEPDVTHVHNLFPNYGTRWLKSWDGPVVATLHNYRKMCPAGTMFRDGGFCGDCASSKSAVPAIRYACYKGSRLQTAPVTIGTKFENDPVLSRADALVCLTPTMKRAFIELGVDANKMRVIPNYLPDDEAGVEHGPGGSEWIYVGRLSAEKGILDLLRSWPTTEALTIIGAGPLEDELRALAAQLPLVTVTGPLMPADVQRRLRHSRGLVFPSIGPEGMPLVYVEALAAGTPVLVTGQSVVAELVLHDGTGESVLLSRLTEDLSQISQRFNGMRTHCRQTFQNNYSERACTEAQIGVYRSLIEETCS